MMDSEQKRRVTKLLPELVNQVDPIEMLPYLTCLSGNSRERIVNCQKQNSSLEAMLILHEHIGKRDKGFDQLVHGLRVLECNDLADRLTLETDSRGEKTNKKSVKYTSKQVHQRRKPIAEHSTFIRDLNAGAFDILERLDYCGTQRWKQLAGHLDYSISDCNKIENDAAVTKENPTVVLIKQCNDLTLGELLHILRYDMERMDVAESLEELTGYKLPVIDDVNNSKAHSKDERNHPNGNELTVKECLPLSPEVIYERQGQQHVERDGNIYDGKSFALKRDTHLERTVDMRDAGVKPLVITPPECPNRINDVIPPQYHQTIIYNTTHLPKPVKKLIKQESSEREEIPVLSQIQNKSRISCQDGHVTTLCSNINNDDESFWSMNPLHAREEHKGTDCTESGVNLIQIPVEGAATILVKQVRFHQQECEQPGPYVPITGGSPVTIHSSNKIILDNDVQSQGTLQDTIQVVPAPELSNSMCISVGDAHSVHHHRDSTQSVSDYTSDGESMFSSNEEKAEIQRKAYKSFPSAISEDIPADINSICKSGNRLDRDQEQSGNISHIHSVSDTDSYEVTSVLTLDDNKGSNSPSGLLLGSEHFTRRMNTKDEGQSDRSVSINQVNGVSEAESYEVTSVLTMDANSVSETDSYEVTSVLSMDDIKRSNSPSGLQLGSELFTRRMNTNEIFRDRDANTVFSKEPTAAFKDVHEAEGENDNSLPGLQSNTGLNLDTRDEIRERSAEGNRGNCTGFQINISDNKLGDEVTLVARGTKEEIDNNGNISDSSLIVGAGAGTHQYNVSEHENNGADNGVSFPWMKSLLFVGTAVAASLAYKGLKG